MRATAIASLIYLCCVSGAEAGKIPEKMTVETLAEPSKSWFINMTVDGAYVFDSASGGMLGMLSVSAFTPAVAISLDRNEAYAAESYLSRGWRGKREDVLTVYDTRTLAPIAEVDIPDKMSEMAIALQVGLLGNGRHVAYYNMTPAQSVGIVDVETRAHVAEVSTPGCAMIMPTARNDFLMICGDGSAQLVRLNDAGQEAERVRSKSFFDVQDDAVFDHAARIGEGWMLVSHQGLVYSLSSSDSGIQVSKPWALATREEHDEQWRPGGFGVVSSHRASGTAYVLMHQGGVDTHHQAGTEIWVVDTAAGIRKARWSLPEPAAGLLALQTQPPTLAATTESGAISIFNGDTGELLRTIKETGPYNNFLQEFGSSD